MAPKKGRTSKRRRKQKNMLDSPDNVRSRISSDYSRESSQNFEVTSSSDNSSEKKPRRKVIRRTEQLQFFDTDASGVTDSTETRPKKRTKKTKRNSVLPNIGDIAEEINTYNRISTRSLTRYHERKLIAEQQDSQPFIDDFSFNKHPKNKRSPKVISEESRNENAISLAPNLFPIDTSAHSQVSDNNKQKNEVKEECKDEVRNVSPKNHSHNLSDEREKISLKEEIQIPQTAAESLISMNVDGCEISVRQNETNAVEEHSLKIKDNIGLKPYSKTPLSTQRSQSGSFKVVTAGKNTSRHQTESIEKPSTRTKMPNFSLIHKKAFEKMESIDQLSQRKAERAKMLLSGNKPPIGLAGLKQSPMVIEDKKSRRYLDFETENKPNNIKSFPLKEINNKFLPKTTTSKIISKSFKLKRDISKPNLLKSKAVVAKPYLPPKSKITTEIVKTDLSPALNGATNHDIKTIKAKNKEGRSEEIKTVANRMKVVKNGLDERRNVIKGVRSNRRFDLLMKMRMKM